MRWSEFFLCSPPRPKTALVCAVAVFGLYLSMGIARASAQEEEEDGIRFASYDDEVNELQPLEQKHELRPYWGSPAIVVADPAEYIHIKSLDNPNRASLGYTMRPNMINQPVPDHWDFNNLINTDRPDFTDATYSVGRGVTVIETGYTVRNSVGTDAHITRRQLPETLLRYGITDEFEVRVKWNGYVIVNETDASGVRATQFGGDDLILGTKWEMKQQDNWVPMFTLVSGSTIPVGTNGISSNAVQPFGNLVYGWGIKRWLYLKGSTGADWLRGQNSRLENGSLAIGPRVVADRDYLVLYHQSFSLLIQYSKHVGGFFEWFALASTKAADNSTNHYIDTGLYIYATPNVQFDVRIGQSIGSPVAELFTGAGLSIRY